MADMLLRPVDSAATMPVRTAVSAATDHLLERQLAEGWWAGELETNVTMTAEHVLLLRFLGLSHDDIREGAIEHLLGAQREDGSWGLYHDAAADTATGCYQFRSCLQSGSGVHTERAIGAGGGSAPAIGLD